MPAHFWRAFFFEGHNPWVTAVWGAVIGPLIALASFTCSIGNVPLAAVLWSGGISFGGVAAFIFGDLIIPPILNIYRKYYGGKPMLFLFVSFYVVMVIAALCVEGLFALLGWIPTLHNVTVTMAHVSFNYTAVLNIIFFIVAVSLIAAFFRSGGPRMMRMMASGDHDHGQANHSCHSGH